MILKKWYEISFILIKIHINYSKEHLIQNTFCWFQIAINFDLSLIMILFISVHITSVLPRFSTAEKVVDKQLLSKNFIDVNVLIIVIIKLKQSGRLDITRVKDIWKIDIKS